VDGPTGVPAARSGQGCGSRALLRRAHDEDRWGVVHAFPGITNAASNGICRSMRFTLLDERDVTFADRVIRTNHWVIDPRTDLD
jgi:hypothetical protein